MPTIDLASSYPPAISPRLGAAAQWADVHRFDAVSMNDHFFSPFGSPDAPQIECFTTAPSWHDGNATDGVSGEQSGPRPSVVVNPARDSDLRPHERRPCRIVSHVHRTFARTLVDSPQELSPICAIFDARDE
jgi:hypothetical protein